MGNSWGCWLTFVCASAACGTAACAREVLDAFEVVKVTPSRVIEHDVSLKGRFDEEVVETDLFGPKYFSQAVGLGEKAARERDAYFNWYEITRSSRERERVLSVRDPLRGSKQCQFRIGGSDFLLSPAQKLTSGAPAPVSDRLSYFKAYRIVNGTPLNEELSLTNGMGPKSRIALKPIFLCIPVEEWHHAAHFPIKQAEDCFIVYELKPCEYKTTVSTIDQFGLNELNVDSSHWLCVPAGGTKTQGKGE